MDLYKILKDSQEFQYLYQYTINNNFMKGAVILFSGETYQNRRFSEMCTQTKQALLDAKIIAIVLGEFFIW